MAGAIIPIFSSAISILGPLVPGIVKGVEALFGAKTGETKLTTAVAMLQKAAEALAAAGKIPGVPDLSALSTMVESVVQSLKAAGQLPTPAAPEGGNGNPSIAAGVSQMISGATVIIMKAT